MGEINIANSKGRDATVATEGVRAPARVRWLDSRGSQAMTVRLVRATMDRDLDALVRAAGGKRLEEVAGKVADALVAGDPEIDCELYGRETGRLWRVFVDAEGKVVHHVTHSEVVRNPDGTEKSRRPRQVSEANVSVDGAPLRWSGKFVPKTEAFRKFVFSSAVQLVHVNGLTYDFLYGIAKELEERDTLLLLGSGPLVFRRDGSPYRGFLEGRTDGDKYSLVLHLSNMELKAPAQAAPTEAAASEAAGEKEVA